MINGPQGQQKRLCVNSTIGMHYFIGRLLQLLLGCAVNCEQKQLYIEKIMNMEESVQQLIMQAIQELMAHQVCLALKPY